MSREGKEERVQTGESAAGRAGLDHLPRARRLGAIALRWFSGFRLKSCPRSELGPSYSLSGTGTTAMRASARRRPALPGMAAWGTSVSAHAGIGRTNAPVVPVARPRRRPRRSRRRRTSTGGWPIALVAIDVIKSSRDTGLPVERSTSRLHAHRASSTMWLGPLRARSVAKVAAGAVPRGPGCACLMASGRAGCGEWRGSVMLV
jgi:hypothetical protein